MKHQQRSESKEPLVSLSRSSKKNVPKKSPSKRDVLKGPLSFDEIKKIRECPTASYLDLVRMLATYDESMKEIEEVRMLSSTHYQHHADTMDMYRDMKKKFDIANETAEISVKRMAKANEEVAEIERRVEEEQKGREFMCSEAGKHLKVKNDIIEFIKSSKTYLTYDSVTKKNDTIVKFSKIDFEKLLESLEE